MFQQATSSAARSTVMQPLLIFLSILTAGLIGGGYYGIPLWILFIIAGLILMGSILFLGFFSYFALRDPDLLRSERFTLSKLAIEKNLIGDSTSGLIEIDEFREVRNITAPPPKRELESRND